MADKYIRDLTAAASVAGTDSLVLDQGGDAVKVTVTQLANAMSTLLDLATTLDGKQPVTPAISALAYAATVDLAFTTADQRRSLALTGNITFTGNAYADTRKATLFISSDSVARTLAFPAGWVFIGTKPTELAANKNAVFTLECIGSTEADVRCAWGAQS